MGRSIRRIEDKVGVILVFNTQIICTKCKSLSKRYDSNRSESYTNWKYCPYCGGKVIHKPYSPDI